MIITTVTCVEIALSLGLYGATLSPAQEFDGLYPPPFGPRGFSVDSSAEDRGYRTIFPAHGRLEAESAAEIPLAEFHLSSIQPPSRPGRA